MTYATREHYRVGPGKCACGFDAYRIDGIMLDYGDLLSTHIRQREQRDKEIRQIAHVAKVPEYSALEEAIYTGIKRSNLTASQERTALTEVLESVRSLYQRVEAAGGAT